MGSDFPVPRSKLPTVTVTREEHAFRKAQMERMLADELAEYEAYCTTDQRRMDPSRWKHVGSREHVKLYREQSVGSGVRLSTPLLEPPAASAGIGSDLAFKGQLRSMRMVGDMTGQVENAIFSVLTKSQEELALVNIFLHDGVGDCAILNMMEGPTAERPFHFLGYKWFVKKVPGGGHIVRHRDTVYMEYCGMTQAPNGDKIGFLLMESVDLPLFPELPQLKIIRAFHSIRFLLRQRKDFVVEVFMTAVLETSVKLIRPVPASADTTFAVIKVMELAESRKLTLMMSSERANRRNHHRRKPADACSLCQQQAKLFSTHSMSCCSVCTRTVCHRCRANKRVFVRVGLKIRVQRVGCCKVCIMEANRANLADQNEDLCQNIPSVSVSEHSDSSSTRTRSASDTSAVEAAEEWRRHSQQSDLRRQTSPRGAVGSPFDIYSDEHNARQQVGDPDDHRFLVRRVSTSTVRDLDPFESKRDGAPPPYHPQPTYARQQPDLYAQMLALCRVAEDTYQATRENRLPQARRV